jgi:hypothetical protein
VAPFAAATPPASIATTAQEARIFAGTSREVRNLPEGLPVSCITYSENAFGHGNGGWPSVTRIWNTDLAAAIRGHGLRIIFSIFGIATA